MSLPYQWNRLYAVGPWKKEKAGTAIRYVTLLWIDQIDFEERPVSLSRHLKAVLDC